MAEGFYQRAEREAAERLKALLDKPLPTDREMISSDDFSPWDAFDKITGSYSGEIDEVAIQVLEAVRDRTTFDLLKGENRVFVEFFLNVLAGHNYVDYGTSPRGAFATPGNVARLLPAWIDKWKAFNAIYWGE